MVVRTDSRAGHVCEARCGPVQHYACMHCVHLAVCMKKMVSNDDADMGLCRGASGMRSVENEQLLIDALQALVGPADFHVCDIVMIVIAVMIDVADDAGVSGR